MVEFCATRLAPKRRCLLSPGYPDGLCPKHHSKDLRLRRTYGISLAQAESVLDAQKWECPVCQKSLEDTDAWVVDHDHKQKIVRGILDRNCNHRVVGRHTDGELLIRAGWYVRNPPAPRVLSYLATVPKKKRKPRKKTPPT